MSLILSLILNGRKRRMSSLSEVCEDEALNSEKEENCGLHSKASNNIANGELLKYGGSGIFIRVVWQEEIVSKEWREGIIVN